MQRPIPKIRAFVDTSVLIAGLASPAGASGAVLDLCEAEVMEMVVSRQIIVEADRNFSAKLPRLVGRFRRFMRDLGPVMVEDPGEDSVKRAAKVVGRKDASILAAAKESGVDFLITLDKKHFLSPRARKGAGLPVVTPAEFLQYFENLYLKE